MKLIYGPETYESGSDAISSAGGLLSARRYELKHVLILTGRTAYSVVQEALELSLTKESITFHVDFFDGLPTRLKAEATAARIKTAGYQAVIAIGGGRSLDNGKLAAYFANVPILTIPTVAATCAAWSLLSVVYHETGGVSEYVYTTKPPIAVIADLDVLRAAPARYLASGIADSVVKRYEVATYYDPKENHFAERLQINLSDFILELLETQDKINTEHAIHAVIFLAGLIGSIQGNVPYGGLAHRFYNQFTHIKQDKTNQPAPLHGEIVGFGLLVQFVCEQREADLIQNYIKKFKTLGLPVTLRQLNLTTNVPETVRDLAQKTFSISPNAQTSSLDWVGLKTPITAETIERAIHQVNAYGEAK